MSSPALDPPPKPATAGERMIDEITAQAHRAAPDQLAGLVSSHAEEAGLHAVALYVADLQRVTLVPLPDGRDSERPPLPIDATLAGRAYQHLSILDQDASEADPAAPTSARRMWLPMVSGSERVGVLAVTLTAEQASDETTLGWVHRLASLTAELVTSKQLYGDAIVRLRRTREMDVAAELQWGLLPPLSFEGTAVSVAGALEPAYEVAGDSLDYAVQADRAHLAVFDAMGHGLDSALMACLAVNAYRKSRRAGGSLVENVGWIEDSLAAGFGTDRFVTGVFAELDTVSGTFSWVNAGHHPPLLLRAGKVVKALEAPQGWPLGLGLGEGALEPAAEQLEPGDHLLIFTDGVVEARSPAGEFFGEDRLADVVLRQLAGGLAGPETMRRVVRSLLEHQQGRLQDDASLMLVEWYGPQ
jgi:hypothetical protein